MVHKIFQKALNYLENITVTLIINQINPFISPNCDFVGFWWGCGLWMPNRFSLHIPVTSASVSACAKSLAFGAPKFPFAINVILSQFLFSNRIRVFKKSSLFPFVLWFRESLQEQSP